MLIIAVRMAATREITVSCHRNPRTLELSHITVTSIALHAQDPGNKE
jgi:hypothetical protein